MSKFKPVTHVIFDLDGLLLDTEGMYAQSIATVCQRYGHQYTDEVRMKVLGTVELDTCRIVCEEFQLPCTVNEFRDQFRAESYKVLTNTVLMPGAELLVRHLHSVKVPIAVATSSSKESVVLKTSLHRDLFSLFDHIVCGSSDPEVKRGKPAPDIFLVAGTRFPDNPPFDKCLVFEDAPNGVIGARDAGMQCVMVPDNSVPEEKRDKATLVLSSLELFKPEQFGLPPFN